MDVRLAAPAQVRLVGNPTDPPALRAAAGPLGPALPVPVPRPFATAMNGLAG